MSSTGTHVSITGKWSRFFIRYIFFSTGQRKKLSALCLGEGRCRMLFLLQNSRLDNEIKERHRSKAKPGQGAFNRAIIDFLTAPVIEEIDCTNYHAQPGSYIIISTSDDFMLASVHLKIENNNGVILEESAAILLDGQLKWIYRPVVPVQEITGNTITVTVIDLPGNAVTGQKTMN